VISSGLPGSKLLIFQNAPSAPVFADLHWRAKGTNQNCCSIKGTKKLLRRGHMRYAQPMRARPDAEEGVRIAAMLALHRLHAPASFAAPFLNGIFESSKLALEWIVDVDPAGSGPSDARGRGTAQRGSVHQVRTASAPHSGRHRILKARSGAETPRRRFKLESDGACRRAFLLFGRRLAGNAFTSAHLLGTKAEIGVAVTH
jgi:hypothetical protein